MVQLNLNGSLTFAVRITVILFLKGGKKKKDPCCRAVSSTSEQAGKVCNVVGRSSGGSDSSCDQRGVIVAGLLRSVWHGAAAGVDAVHGEPSDPARHHVPFACFARSDARKRLATRPPAASSSAARSAPASPNDSLPSPGAVNRI